MDKKPAETVDLSILIQEYQIANLSFFKSYLVEIWSDLQLRSKGKTKGIEKHIFAKYYNIPGILLERLFAVFDKNNDNILDKHEFIEGMQRLFLQENSFDSLAKFIFEFYDFDKNGKINKEDVRLVLSYLPSYIDSNKNEKFKDVIDSQDQLCRIINLAFGEKEELDIDSFCNAVKTINSDIFILVLTFLLEKRPFSKATIIQYMKNQNISPDIMISKTPQVKSDKIASPSFHTKFTSPSLLKKSEHVSKFANQKNNPLDMYAGVTAKEKKEDDPRRPDRRNHSRLDKLQEISPQINNKPLFNKNKAEEILNSYFDYAEEDGNPLISYEGYIYKISGEKMKQVYFRLVGRDLYFYKNKEDKKHKGMHNLSGVFAKEGTEAEAGGKKFYCIDIVYPQTKKSYYFDTVEYRNIWLEKLQAAIEHKSITDSYDIFRKIGQGKFGLVKYGKNKETHQSVAIKIMTKKEMDQSDLELAITEINILKMCQHPNTIKLYDVFETADHIYIVMEYCKGGDLFSYIEESDYKLPEERACEIIHKLSMAIYFIHSFGIIHRDLKPENILMTDDTVNADIRLLDFGLSKIIGPNEKCTEPYGTLSFVAPEVLRGKPYGMEVDLWSIGIIAFLLLAGYLPFDDKHSEKEIARQTIFEPTPFEDKIWNNLSKESKDFVDGLLQKDPTKRLTIEQTLEHPWIKKYSKVPDNRDQSKNQDGNKFAAYTSTSN